MNLLAKTMTLRRFCHCSQDTQSEDDESDHSPEQNLLEIMKSVFLGEKISNQECFEWKFPFKECSGQNNFETMRRNRNSLYVFVSVNFVYDEPLWTK